MTELPKSNDGLYFLPLGGAGEIGMNLNLLGYGPPERPRWLMIDCGVTFGDDTTPGVDLIMADPHFIEAAEGSSRPRAHSRA